MPSISRYIAPFVLSVLLPLTVSAQDRFRGVTVAPDISASDLSDLAGWKANVIRYQLAWGEADTGTHDEYMTWLDGALTQLDGVLAAAGQNGIKVVVDLHTPPGGFASKTTPALMRVFSEKWAQDALVEAWTKIAQHLAASDAIYGYDLLSEPGQRSVAAGLKDWNGLVVDVANAVRAVDQTHRLIVEPLYGDQARLPRLKPISDSNTVYSIHMYYPLKFQHQGLYGNPLGVVYPKGKFNKGSLEKNLTKAVAFARKHKVKIYVGEFSAVRWAPKDSAFRYLKDVISIFEKRKWDWTYHAFREADPWSVEHGTDANDHTRSLTQTNREQLLRKFFAKN